MKNTRFLILFFLIGALSLDAAILDDFVEKIQHEISHKKNKKKRHKRHRRHTKHHHIRTLSTHAKYQKALQFLGYYHGKIDGDLSTSDSFYAIMAFHMKHNQIKTGFLEEEDKRYLSEIYRAITLNRYLSYTGKNKRKGYQKLQAALAVESLYNGTIDGLFGKASKKALKRYIAQIDSNTGITEKEAKRQLVQKAKEKIKKEVAEIKEDTFDPNMYAVTAE